MLPGADRLHEGLHFFLRARGLRVELSKPLIAAALLEATTLAGDAAHDEPAALFFACARRPAAFGRASQLAIPLLAQNQARAVGLELTVEAGDVELILLRLRIIRSEIQFDEVRAWFAAHLDKAP